MSYQVLARKWRPGNFHEMVGQEHVLRALINALDHNRLHHAYLFTGTRGVGKTTIARILAKCLNCEVGVSSNPCGQCSACTEIAEGRFVDLIEVDAASRTKVEDTRELLENVQYAPTRGRYKVYLIDEVHMLSSHSFNALLKTLEEPPPHVKFLLATTDPQKLPVTILSRCLQFNLKNMNPERIVQHLQFVLEKEMVPFEESALWQLGRAADGSMRDAMSLTDQAIAFGSGKVVEADVRAMLGTLDQSLVYSIVEALASLDGQKILTAVEQLSEHSPDYSAALAELLAVLHRIAIAQALPEAVDNSSGDRDQVLALAQQLASEDVQLFYQTALLGRRDLVLAPDPRAGFEMTLLRMLAFKPQGVLDVPKRPLPQATVAASEVSDSPAPDFAVPVQPAAPIVAPSEEVAPAKKPIAESAAAQEQPADVQSQAPWAADGNSAAEQQVNPRTSTVVQDAPPWGVDAPASAAEPASAAPESLPWAKDDVSSADPVSAPEAVTTSAPEVSAAADSTTSESIASERMPEVSHAAVVVETVSEVLSSPVVETPVVEVSRPAPVEKLALAQVSPDHWTQVYLGLGVGGVLQSTVANSQLLRIEANQFFFRLDQNHATLFDESHCQRLSQLLSDYFSEPVVAHIKLGSVTAETPAATAIRLRRERQALAVATIESDPVVQRLLEHFSATLNRDSVEPID